MIDRCLRLLVVLLGSLSVAAAMAQDEAVRPYRGELRSGSPETNRATGSMEVAVRPDGEVSGRIDVQGTAAASAEIRQGGRVVVPLVRAGGGTFLVPSGARLTRSQYDSYLEGDLSVVVHDAADPGGELRGQILRPTPTLGTRLNDPLQPQVAPAPPMTSPMGITTPMSGRGRK